MLPHNYRIKYTHLTYASRYDRTNVCVRSHCHWQARRRMEDGPCNVQTEQCAFVQLCTAIDTNGNGENPFGLWPRSDNCKHNANGIRERNCVMKEKCILALLPWTVDGDKFPRGAERASSYLFHLLRSLLNVMQCEIKCKH